MLPLELVRLRLRKGKVEPLFIGPSDQAVYDVLQIARTSKTLGEFEEKASDLERAYDPKLIRALVRIVIRESRRHLDVVGDPRRAREYLFSRGPVLSREEREEVIREGSKLLGFDLESSAWSDLEEFSRFEEVLPKNEKELAETYNLSLLQSVMFRAASVEILPSSRWQEILFYAKRLGLMYDFNSENMSLNLYGPISLIKLTTKYGRSLALLLPVLMRGAPWRLRAEIVLGKSNRKIYSMEVSSSSAPFPSPTVQLTFDSKVEEDFYSRFRRNSNGWSIVREPGPLKAGDRIFLPDFLLAKGNLRVYLEIVGFWTREYIDQKVRKLKEVKEKVLILVDSSLDSGRFDPHVVITYRDRVDVSRVMDRLTQLETEAFKDVPLPYLVGEVIDLYRVSKDYGIPVNVLKSKEINGYMKLGDYLIREDYVERMRKEDFHGRSLAEVIGKYGPHMPVLLPSLGYDIEWRGIDPSSALIKRSARRTQQGL